MPVALEADREAAREAHVDGVGAGDRLPSGRMPQAQSRRQPLKSADRRTPRKPAKGRRGVEPTRVPNDPPAVTPRPTSSAAAPPRDPVPRCATSISATAAADEKRHAQPSLVRDQRPHPGAPRAHAEVASADSADLTIAMSQPARAEHQAYASRRRNHHLEPAGEMIRVDERPETRPREIGSLVIQSTRPLPATSSRAPASP